MIRQWIKVLVLVLALLSQVAMSCQNGGGQSSGSSSPESAPPARGGY
jgi:hypothetical protein